jgi:hypothetical protein
MSSPYRVHRLLDPPAAELTRALEVFERQFSYPLGPGTTFRISHGVDYARFFRAMGEAAVFVAEHHGQVLGTVGAALRPLRVPDGSEVQVGYLGDLKVLPAARGGLTLLRLLRAVQAVGAGRTENMFSVVMDGTPVSPTAYSGRLGIPAVAELGQIMVFRVPTAGVPGALAGDPPWSSAGTAAQCHRRWTRGRCATVAGNAALRSELPPTPLALPDGSACGLLEDTRHAKRLLTGDGELRSAHLSNFAYRAPADGAALIRAALPLAARHGNPALFVAVSTAEAAALQSHLDIPEAVAAGATVYGAGLPVGVPWNVNTAEI